MIDGAVETEQFSDSADWLSLCKMQYFDLAGHCVLQLTGICGVLGSLTPLDRPSQFWWLHFWVPQWL
jgi:hypothetical protein